MLDRDVYLFHSPGQGMGNSLLLARRTSFTRCWKLRNLTSFAHLDTVEEGAPDLDVGVKIFKGLNVSRDLPIPVVIRFDYSGRVPGARERAIQDCHRVNQAIAFRYSDLIKEGLLHTCLTVRDRNKTSSAEVVGSTLDPQIQEAH